MEQYVIEGHYTRLLLHPAAQGLQNGSGRRHIGQRRAIMYFTHPGYQQRAG